MVDRRLQSKQTEVDSRFTEWSAGETSQRSIGDDGSATFIQSHGFNLHLRTKKVTQSHRTIIPATKWERLSFYRAYNASPNRKQILIMQHARFNRFLWYYVFNIFMKSFPHTFAHLFLASYAPDQHIFLPKMVPIIQGCKYSFVIAGFFELLTYADTMVLMVFFTVSSILYKNPWNRCENNTFIEPKLGVVVHCYAMDDFAKKFINDTPVFTETAYLTSENEYFQLSQLVYYRLHRHNFLRNLSYFIFIWVAAGLLHTRVFTKTFWTILHRFHWIVNGIDVALFVYLIGVYFQMLIENRTDYETPIFPVAEALWAINLDMLVEGITTPPLVNVLTSRSTQPIKPSQDSAMIMASNAICFLLRGLLISRVKKYCETTLNAPLFFSESNRFSWFYIYTIFFATFNFGELLTMGFFTMYLVTELMIFTVAYHCLVEAAVNEWKCVTRWILVPVLTVVATFIYCITNYMTRFILFIYGTGISTLCEVLFLYLLYPLGRLIDDYTFHFGEKLTTLRILSMRIVPFYYVVKFYWLVSGIFEVFATFKFLFPSSFLWAWTIIVAPLVFGVLMISYRYVVLDRKDWRLMFRPDPHWGPKEFQARQLRKQFDSRHYIGSQYPRLLSRYLLKKAEAESYNLDVHYEIPQNSAPKGQDDHIRFVSEKIY